MKRFLLAYVAVLASLALLPAAELKVTLADLSPAKRAELERNGYTQFEVSLSSLAETQQRLQAEIKTLIAPLPPSRVVDPQWLYWTQPALLPTSCVGGNCGVLKR